MKRASESFDSQPARQRGITIIEIMVTLAIAAVLIGLAVPAFNAFVAQRTLTAQVNDFLVAVQYARSEAGRRGAAVSVQALERRRPRRTSGVRVGASWSARPARVPTTATELRTFTALGANTSDGAGALDGVAHAGVQFARLLLPPAAAGTLNLCNPREHVGREISISAIGRVSSREPPVATLDCNP